MSYRSKRLEVLEALAEFRACLAFSRGMARLNSPADPVLQGIIEELGAPRPAKRAGQRAAPRRKIASP